VTDQRASVVIVMDGTNDTVNGPGSADAIIAARCAPSSTSCTTPALPCSWRSPIKDTVFSLRARRKAIAVRNHRDWIRNEAAQTAWWIFTPVRDPATSTGCGRNTTTAAAHPNVAGLRAMAGAVDLGLLRGPACSRSDD
jgi:hypothetical protein